QEEIVDGGPIVPVSGERPGHAPCAHGPDQVREQGLGKMLETGTQPGTADSAVGVVGSVADHSAVFLHKKAPGGIEIPGPDALLHFRHGGRLEFGQGGSRLVINGGLSGLISGLKSANLHEVTLPTFPAQHPRCVTRSLLPWTSVFPGPGSAGRWGCCP